MTTVAKKIIIIKKTGVEALVYSQKRKPSNIIGLSKVTQKRSGKQGPYPSHICSVLALTEVKLTKGFKSQSTK